MTPTWELRNGLINVVALLLPAEEGDTLESVFDTNGQPKRWQSPPRVKAAVETRTRRAKPRADLSYLRAGSIVLNRAAYLALGTFLMQFGQLLEIDCDGEIEYFYNVTTVLDCLDPQEFEAGRDVVRPGTLPDTPLVFKDPRTARGAIYVNEAARQELERLIGAAGLTGARFVTAGQEDY